MKPSFVAGFGPIVPDAAESRAFWESAVGIGLNELDPGYFGTDDLAGVRAFALWPLAQAAESCFGASTWPADIPRPQAWIEFDVEAPEAVFRSAVELEARGQRLLKQPAIEPWGQTVARLLSPEGLLVGITYTPLMHGERPADPEAQP